MSMLVRVARRLRSWGWWGIAAAVALTCAVSACSGTDDAGGAGSVPEDFSAERCLVRVHGRSDTGAPPERRDGYAVVAPDGNERFDSGGRVWVYDDEASYASARERLVEVIEAVGCEQVVLHGFSNGAAFVGSLVCRGETFDGRLRGAMIDDPVPDDSSPDCSPDPGVQLVLYWTGGLAEAVAGTPCDDLGWTCAGTELVGVEEYARRLGIEVTTSAHDEHRPYDDAPELTEWLSED